MKILSAAQVCQWDEYTIKEEPISAIDLMERAATKCVEWLLAKFPLAPSFAICCGKGNNGGDGLAIARMLLEQGYPVTVYILEFGHKGTADFQTNLARLHQLPQPDIHFIQSADHFHTFRTGQVIIEALLGTGVSRPLEGVTAALVTHINNSGCEIVAIDIPAGLFADHSCKGALTIHATHTLSFQCYKPALLLAENETAIGEVHILDIGLHYDFYESLNTAFELVDDDIIYAIYKPRKTFAHKGTFGHTLLIAGSYGKMGAAILAARACLRSGVGLLTCYIPTEGYDSMQTTVPEAMVLTKTANDNLDDAPIRYNAAGIGPGIGVTGETKKMLKEFLLLYKKPLVLDADALNILASQKELFSLIPAGSILTPHPKEFERLFGETANEFDNTALALQKAKELDCIIVLKGHHTFIATPGGKGYFNATGNAGMATGGSGDVLTGLLTGFLAQGYSSEEAAIFGVYLHGRAGDIAAAKLSMEAMLAGDIVTYLGDAFLALNS